MKTKYYFGFVGLLLCFVVCLSSCEGGGIGGNAPKSVAGKTMEIQNDEGNLLWTIKFSSNSSASIELSSSHISYSYSSISYKKTGSESATLQIKEAYEDGYRMYGTEDINYSLIFTSPNQGIANSRYTFTLF